MTNHQALAMPDYVAQLVRLPLARMNLEPSEVEGDIVSCPLLYEDGTMLSLVVLCVSERGWFREKPMLVLSIVALDQNTRAVRIYCRETISAPTGPSDLPFMIRLSAKVRANAWTLAVTEKMGECVSLPGRPPHVNGR
jgi:hypothetical protein